MKVQDAIKLVDGRTAAFSNSTEETEREGVGFQLDAEMQRSYLLGMELDDPDTLWEAVSAVSNALFMLLTRTRFNPVLTIRSSLLQMVMLGYVLGEAAGRRNEQTESDE